ncbi:MAG: hypothetical protein ACE5FI_00715 [Anaerolineales bacterium]
MNNRGSIIVNLLTLLIIVAAGCSGVYFLAVFSNPNGGLNLFPPPTKPAVAVLPTPTETPLFPTLPPVWTPTEPPVAADTPTATASASATAAESTVTSTPSKTATPTETATLEPGADTPTPTATGPTPTPSATVAPTNTLSPFQFTLQADGIQYTRNFVYPELDCNWMGIAGQVFDLNNKPLIGNLVHLEGGGFSVDAITGTKSEYGPGGYEHILDSTPKDTTDEYVVQLLDPTGAALSDQIVVPTFADCNRNLILVNFVQNH